MIESQRLEPLLSSSEIADRVHAVAEAIEPRLALDAVAICLLSGGLWFAADLSRALASLGRPLGFDALWLASYGDTTQSAGHCEVHAKLQRPVAGRQALVIDDVIDSGLSLAEARRHLLAGGAREVLTAVFARKPWPRERQVTPDFVAWEAPARFLVGYGMDLAGEFRALPYVAALAEPASHGAIASRASMAS